MLWTTLESEGVAVWPLGTYRTAGTHVTIPAVVLHGNAARLAACPEEISVALPSCHASLQGRQTVKYALEMFLPCNPWMFQGKSDSRLARCAGVQ